MLEFSYYFYVYQMNLTKKSQLNELINFIKTTRDSREVKRAIAVKLALEGYTYTKIQLILNISLGFISKWKEIFLSEGIGGLTLKYKGAKPLLNPNEKQEVINWLQQKDYWDLKELYSYIFINYEITFKSKQSYYDLFRQAGISWKKSQKAHRPCGGFLRIRTEQAKNPKRDPDLVKKKGRNNSKVARMATQN